MAGDFVVFSEADGASGEPVLDIGGVRGVVYCTGFDCDCSKVWNMIAVCWHKRDMRWRAGRTLVCDLDLHRNVARLAVIYSVGLGMGQGPGRLKVSNYEGRKQGAGGMVPLNHGRLVWKSLPRRLWEA